MPVYPTNGLPSINETSAGEGADADGRGPVGEEDGARDWMDSDGLG